MTDAWSAPPLRLGLEPGYDGGRFGAWLLDVPGAFGWARNEGAAISQSMSVAGWWREWLARHGDAWPIDPFGASEVVETVAASVRDGYERNATFDADRAVLTGDALEAAIRRLDYARADLLALADVLGDRELATDGDERTAGAVLRHLADVEIWLGSRLDPGARYDGRLDEPDDRGHLASTRSWATANLRRLHATDPAAERTDGKGETWTLAKVVRRYVYHAVDHLRELDHRLAVAEDRVGRLRFTDEPLAEVAPLVRLLRSVGWDRRTRDPARLARALEHTEAMVSAWDGDELVGFTRELGDGVFNAYLSMVVVDPRWQGLGIATRLLDMVMNGRTNVRFSLNAASGVEGYYEGFGFEHDPSAMVRPRR
jgi:GNAT superfamily N-acetyltransferase